MERIGHPQLAEPRLPRGDVPEQDEPIKAGKVATYESLLRQVWRERGDAKDVRTFVKKLRRKLGDDAARPAWILTERGGGYRMVGPDDA